MIKPIVKTASGRWGEADMVTPFRIPAGARLTIPGDHYFRSDLMLQIDGLVIIDTDALLLT
ncbi:MAG: hypothetical protein WCF85_16375 [Rhodospirillaceae bacterium]